MHSSAWIQEMWPSKESTANTSGRVAIDENWKCIRAGYTYSSKVHVVRYG